MPPAKPKKPESNWWFDAVKRPLGAFSRIETASDSDLHVALAEVGVLVASAQCHQGWLRGSDPGRHETGGVREIP